MSPNFEREIKNFLGPRGPLTRLLPRYQCRPEQAQMAGAVLRALAGRSIAIVEAGTGTGKTLAYLAPAIYSGERVVISTGTKALQEQLINKDLPVLAREFKINAALMKGRTNYLCWRRYHEFEREPSFRFREEISFYELVQRWAQRTQTGDRAEIKGLPDEYSAWREITASGEQCTFQKCEYFDPCFITRMRVRAQQSEIVVVNHHLFFADLSIRSDAPGAIIPSYQSVIFDEAHSLAEVATEYFGAQVSTWRLSDLCQDVRRLQRAGSVPVEELRAMLKGLESAETATGLLLRAVAEAGRSSADGGAEGSRFSLEPLGRDPSIREAGERAVEELKLLGATLAALSRHEESVSYLSERAGSLGSDLSLILTQEDPELVYWAETRGRGVVLRASPAELGPILSERLYAPPMPLVFTSATLAVQSQGHWSFGHFRTELGLTEPPRRLEEVWLKSSYDWEGQALLYVPTGLPDPNQPDFIGQAAMEMERILNISRGRAFLLFTSYRNLEAAYNLLAERLPYNLLRQGDAPKSELLDRFREEESSVLFATQSFWEGVDVSGQALSCVVVDKLPFGSPGDPLLAARIARLRRKGGNPFNDYQLPAAVISLKQGLGRLMRNQDDYGILAVLDSRLHKRQYGRVFLQSLPPAPLTTRLQDLEAFFDRHEGRGAKSV